MKVYGRPFLRARSFPVQLLRDQGMTPIPRCELTFADLWRSGVVHEGVPDRDDGAYHCVTVFGRVPPEASVSEAIEAEVNVDVLDADSADRLVALFTDVNDAEQGLLSAMRDGPMADRVRCADSVAALGRRWANLTPPMPCTIEVEDAPGARIYAGKVEGVLRQRAPDARTIFWTLYARQADGTSQASIDVIDWEGVQLVEAARERLSRLLALAIQVRADLASNREPVLDFAEMDLAPAPWPYVNDTGVPEWLRSLAARGVDVDPGAENLAETLGALRGEDGTPRMGRLSAHKLAWQRDHLLKAGVCSVDDLREMAAEHMPAAAAALSHSNMASACP